MEKLQNYDFEMYSKAGNNVCRSIVNKAFKKIEGSKRITLEELNEQIRKGMEAVQEKHEEIYDTEPRCHIEDLVNKKLQETGYSFRVSRYDF